MAILLLILFVSLTITLLYLIRIGATDHFMRLRSALPFSFLLSIAMAFMVYKEFNATNEIAKYITPYNGNMSAIYTPMGHIWQFETTDSKNKVTLFYSKEENYKGWNLIRGFPFMTLQKDNIQIQIDLHEKNGNGAKITYTLSNIKK